MSVIIEAVEAVGDFIGDAVEFVVDTVQAIIADPLPTLLAIGGQMIGIPVPVTMAAITGARGGSLEDMARAAVSAYVGQSVAPVIAGSISPTVTANIANKAVANAVTNAVTSGLVNGTIAEINGGDFVQGFTGGFVGSAVGSGTQEIIGKPTMEFAKSLGFDEKTGRAVVSAISSSTGEGAGAAATGGDFSIAFQRGLSNAGVDFAATKASDAIEDYLRKSTASNDAELKEKYEKTKNINKEIQNNAAAQKKIADEANERAMAVNDKQRALQDEIDAFNNNPNRTQEESDALQAKVSAFAVEHQEAMDFYTKQQEKIKTLQAGQEDLIKQYEYATSGTQQTAEEFFIQEEKNAARIKEAYDLNEQYKTLTGEELTPEKLAELQKSGNAKEAAAKDLGFDSVDSMQTALTIKSLNPEVAPKLEARQGETAGQLVKEVLEDGSVVYSRTFSGTTPDGQQYAYKATYDEKNPRGVEYEVLNGVSQDYKTGTPVEVVSGTERPYFGNAQPEENLNGTGVKKTPADLQKDAADAYNNFVNASVLAKLAPTPENIEAADQAKLNSELAKKMADDSSVIVNTDITDIALNDKQNVDNGLGVLKPIDLEELPVKSNQSFPTSTTVGVNENVNPNEGLINIIGDVTKDVIKGGLSNALAGGTTGGTTGTTNVPKTGATTPAPTVTSGLAPVAVSNTASPSIFFEAPNIMMTPQQIAERENFILTRKIKRGGLVSKRKK
jgi:uncharacterized membrane protein YjfL (UPF0719 family)